MVFSVTILALTLAGAGAAAYGSVFEDCAGVRHQLGGMNAVVMDSFVLLPIPGQPNMRMVHADGIDYGECSIAEANPVAPTAPAPPLADPPPPQAPPAPLNPFAGVPATPSPQPIAVGPPPVPSSPTFIGNPPAETPSPAVTAQSPPKKNEAPTPSPEQRPQESPPPPLRSRNLASVTPAPDFKGVLGEKPLPFDERWEEPSVRRSHGGVPQPAAEPRQAAKEITRSISSDTIEAGLISAQQRAEQKWNEEADRLVGDPNASLDSLEEQLRRLIALDPDSPVNPDFAAGPKTKKANRADASTSPDSITRSRSIPLALGQFSMDEGGQSTDQSGDLTSAPRRKNPRSDADDNASVTQPISDPLSGPDTLSQSEANPNAAALPGTEKSGVSQKLVRGLMKRITRLHDKASDAGESEWADSPAADPTSERLGGRPAPPRGLAAIGSLTMKDEPQSRYPFAAALALTTFALLLALKLHRRKRR